MKRLYSICFLVLMLTTLSANRVFADDKEMMLGYVSHTAEMYEYDGISLDHDATVSVAILLPKAMLEPYVGGTIVGMYAGWDILDQTGNYKGWVRRSFNGENLTQSAITKVKATEGQYYTLNGWNRLTLDSLVITPDMDTLICGFTTHLSKDVCTIPLVYPGNVKNADYRAVHDDLDSNGNIVWYDFSYDRALPIVLIIADTKGGFNNSAQILNVMCNGFAPTGDALSAIVQVKNTGANPLKKLDFTTTLGTKTSTESVALSSSIASGSSAYVSAPVFCWETGTNQLSITKVNGETNDLDQQYKVKVIGIPESVSSKYTHRPLLEYYTSENSYMGGAYYDNIVGPGLTNYQDKMTFVCQHMNDQFMTGDDDATRMALDFVYNDSSRVSLPAISLDRALSYDNIVWQKSVPYTPLDNVLYEPFSGIFYEGALNIPTFASVEGKADINATKDTVTIKVNGYVEPGILPAGEKPYLTIYFMEKDVVSDSQTFWSEEEEQLSEGKYTHPNIIRQILTELYGDPISEGDYTKEVKIDLDPSWNTDNCYVVAFVNRGVKNDHFSRHVINSTQFNITLPTGIEEVKAANSETRQDIYDLSGRKVSGLKKGIYIKQNKKFFVK